MAHKQQSPRVAHTAAFLLISTLLVEAAGVITSVGDLGTGSQKQKSRLMRREKLVSQEQRWWFEPTDVQFDEEVRTQLDAMFNHQKDASARIEVTATSLGKWNPSPDCETPKLWLFLSGQYRTFDNTKDNIAQMVKKSSGDCFFVSAAIPSEVGYSTKDHSQDLASYSKAVSRGVHESLIGTQQDVFGGRLAFAIINRAGFYDGPGKGTEGVDWWEPPQDSLLRAQGGKKTGGHSSMQTLQGALDTFWYSVYLVSDLASKHLKITPSPHSVVLRTRPDVDFFGWFKLDNVMKYFSEGHRGRHLLLRGGEGHWPAGVAINTTQADIVSITSYEGYKTDIAQAYSKEGVSMARANGWGYGWSICGWKTPCSDQTAGPVVNIPKSCTSGPVDYSRKECCKGQSCPMTVVETPVKPWKIIRRGAEEFHGSWDMPGYDLAEGLSLYCPIQLEDYDTSIAELPLYKNPSMPPLQKPLDESSHFHRSRSKFSLVKDGGAAEVWPKGC